MTTTSDGWFLDKIDQVAKLTEITFTSERNDFFR